MHCRRCGIELDDQAIACTSCGVAPLNGTKFCHRCGANTVDEAIICVKCGVSLAGAPARGFPAANLRLAAALSGILLGALGVHKFILGYWVEGTIMLAISVLSLSVLAWIPAVIGIIEGILYLTKTDAEFEEAYIKNKRGWF